MNDWHLQAGSPAIGAGNPNTFIGFLGESIDVSKDKDGVQRVLPWDIGIYAYTPTPTPTPTTTSTPCSQYTSTSVFPTGYASPYDVVSSPTTNLIQATCDTSSVKVDLGTGNALQYIYNTGYVFKTGGSAWNPIPYTSSKSLVANAWYPKNANAR